MIPLLPLGLFQAESRWIIVGRRIGHRRIEPELEKVVSEIVVLADIITALTMAVGPQRVADAVDESQQVKNPRGAYILRANPREVIAVENEPADGLGQILRLPFSGQVSLGKSNGPKENTATIEVLILHRQLRMELLPKAAEESARSSGHRDPQLPAPGTGKGIENKLTIEFFSKCHGCDGSSFFYRGSGGFSPARVYRILLNSLFWNEKVASPELPPRCKPLPLSLQGCGLGSSPWERTR